MKRFGQSVSAVVLGIALGPGLGLAQSLRDAQVPAEFPPASYKGTQYVDSRGCVYIRAGVDGVTTWVPRVARDRTPVCGKVPTQVAGTTLTAPRARGVEQITLDAPQTAAPAPAPAPEPAASQPVARTAARAAPAPQPAPRPVPQTTRRAAQAAAATAAPAPQPKPLAAPAPRRQASTTAAAICEGATPLSTRYINNGRDGITVRCGPQTIRPSGPPQAAASTPRTAQSGSPASAAPAANQRVVPAHVAEARRDNRAFEVPKGYRQAWDDDRLNPRRAEGTRAGWQQMALVWTNTLPRRLIDQRSGRDVTASVPLVYPFTDQATQEAQLGKVTLATRNGTPIKRVQRKPGAPSLAELAARGTAAPAAASAPARAQPAAPQRANGGRYVQVATFGVPQNAQATARKLQRTGLPVQIGTLKRGGKTYRLVLAGPFDDSAGTQRALQIARQAGFADAYIRK